MQFFEKAIKCLEFGFAKDVIDSDRRVKSNKGVVWILSVLDE